MTPKWLVKAMEQAVVETGLQSKSEINSEEAVKISDKVNEILQKGKSMPSTYDAHDVGICKGDCPHCHDEALRIEHKFSVAWKKLFGENGGEDVSDT